MSHQPKSNDTEEGGDKMMKKYKLAPIIIGTTCCIGGAICIGLISYLHTETVWWVLTFVAGVLAGVAYVYLWAFAVAVINTLKEKRIKPPNNGAIDEKI